MRWHCLSTFLGILNTSLCLQTPSPPCPRIRHLRSSHPTYDMWRQGHEDVQSCGSHKISALLVAHMSACLCLTCSSSGTATHLRLGVAHAMAFTSIGSPFSHGHCCFTTLTGAVCRSRPFSHGHCCFTTLTGAVRRSRSFSHGHCRFTTLTGAVRRSRPSPHMAAAVLPPRRRSRPFLH